MYSFSDEKKPFSVLLAFNDTVSSSGKETRLYSLQSFSETNSDRVSVYSLPPPRARPYPSGSFLPRVAIPAVRPDAKLHSSKLSPRLPGGGLPFLLRVRLFIVVIVAIVVLFFSDVVAPETVPTSPPKIAPRRARPKRQMTGGGEGPRTV